MDYSTIPFFDNHTHPLDEDKTVFTPDTLALSWLHGFRDLPNGKVSNNLAYHVRNQGVVFTMVKQLSDFFGCACTLEAVTEVRNKRLQNGVKAYATQLYADAGIFASLVDCGLPYNDPQLDLFPGKLLRHIQLDPVFWEALTGLDSYVNFLAYVRRKVTEAIREHGCAAIKSHIGELFTLCVRYVTPQEAQRSYTSAKQGDKAAQQTVYYAMFYEVMLLAHELNVPLHIHTGMTGGMWKGEVYDCDPYRMVPFLMNTPRMMDTTLVLLHSNYPFMKSAALMSHTFPNVWSDLAWVLPWNALNFAECIESLIAICPVSKILLGSGQHNIPEIAWLSSKVARQSLKYVMDKLALQELLSPEQGFEIAEMLMYKNAKQLYNL